MATWRSVSSKLRGAMAVGAILITIAVGASVVPFLMSCEGTVEAGPNPAAVAREKRAQKRAEEAAAFRQRWADRERESEARWKQLEDDAQERREALEAEIAKAPAPKRVRRVRRFQWESPAETRSKIWNVPEEETEEALLTALLRVCIAEADGAPQDCAGIWQVVKNNRRRSCDRGMIRRITECDEDGGETYLSALRRHQRHVLGYIKARNRRAAWVSKLTLDCERPESYPRTQDQWDAHYGSKVCPQTIADARRLIGGELPESAPGRRIRWLPGRPMTWGGRCETGKAACDDRIACSRGLARIPNTGTLNAFWCRPGSAGCPEDIDPICLQMGYKSLRTPAAEAETVTAIEEPEGSDENS